MMNIKPGMLVKTLTGSIVKVEKEPVEGYWQCDDGRIHLGQTFREADAEEVLLYAAAHSTPDTRQDNTGSHNSSYIS